MEELHWPILFALFTVGIISSIINIVAGGGSYLNLPLLMFTGLPPTVANGTNRVGVLAGLLTGTYKFARAGQLRRGDLLLYCLPAALGGILGAWLALQIDDRSLRVVLAILMFFGSWTVIRRPTPDHAEGEPEPKPLLAWVLFLAVGVYGGFIQAGTGFFAMAATGLLGLDLKRGNGVKTLMNLCMTGPALAIFASNGLVNWPTGLALASGMAVGGVLGVRVSQGSKPRTLKKMVAAAIILSAFFVLKPFF